MKHETLTRLFNLMTEGYGIDDTVAGHLVNDVEELVEEPDRTPHGLTLCKVCRAPTRPPEPEAKASSDPDRDQSVTPAVTAAREGNA